MKLGDIFFIRNFLVYWEAIPNKKFSFTGNRLTFYLGRLLQAGFIYRLTIFNLLNNDGIHFQIEEGRKKMLCYIPCVWVWSLNFFSFISNADFFPTPIAWCVPILESFSMLMIASTTIMWYIGCQFWVKVFIQHRKVTTRNVIQYMKHGD